MAFLRVGGSIRARVTLLSAGSVALTAFLLAGFGAWQADRTGTAAREQVEGLTSHQLDVISTGVDQLVTTQGDSVTQQVSSNLNVAADVMARAGGLNLGTDSVAWTATNQITKEATPVSLPRALVGGSWLGQNKDLAVATPVVDTIKSLVGGTATIFQRMPDGSMLRVATNVESLTKTRAIGTYIPAVAADGTRNPIISSVESGKIFRGTAFVVSAYYVTAYEPLKDASGAVIGMLYVGIPEENIPTLRQGLLDTKVGPHGFVEVLGGLADRTGLMLITPRTGVTTADEVKDADGGTHLTRVVAAATSLEPGQFSTVRYRAQDSGWHTVRVSYYKPWDWVIAVDATDSDFAGVSDQLAAGTHHLIVVLMGAGALAAVLAGLVAAIAGRRMTRPLERLRARMQEVAQGNGDLTSQLDEGEPGEAGQLARAFNSFVSTIAETVTGVMTIAQRLDGTATDVSRIATELEDVSSRSAHQVHATSTAAAEVGQHVQDLSQGSQEMSASIADISHNASQAASVAGEAVRTVEETTARVEQLSSSSAGIDAVVKAITAIAGQTNLLALNATIEAARAGESGKGFAVVAHEVKELARETAEATEDIGRRVAAIQADTEAVSTAMARVGEVMSSINGYQTNIASAVREQTATTDGMRQRMETTSTASTQITDGIRAAADAAGTTSDRAGEARAAASELADLTGSLGALVSQFRA